ncbi:MAG TPA: hypothetical protein VK174_13310 [Chitinophagales bacterium]|nr:hypothetical protein [Chitinophagales bacterium]
MIEARGNGFLVIAIGVISVIATFALGAGIITWLKLEVHDEFFKFLGGIALILAGYGCGLIKTDEDDAFDSTSSFMFIPYRYWPNIYKVVGLLIMLDAVLIYSNI